MWDALLAYKFPMQMSQAAADLLFVSVVPGPDWLPEEIWREYGTAKSKSKVGLFARVKERDGFCSTPEWVTAEGCYQSH